MPQLCLGVSDTKVDLTLGKETVSGFVVNIQKKATGNTYQQWQFNPDASVTCLVRGIVFKMFSPIPIRTALRNILVQEGISLTFTCPYKRMLV